MVPQAKAASNNAADRKPHENRALAALNWMSYRSSLPPASTFLPSLSKSLTKIDKAQVLILLIDFIDYLLILILVHLFYATQMLSELCLL